MRGRFEEMERTCLMSADARLVAQLLAIDAETLGRLVDWSMPSQTIRPTAAQ